MLRRCLNESLDLQKGIIDRCTQNLHMPTSYQLPPQVSPVASSTPHVQMPAVQIQGNQSFQAETHTRTENIVGLCGEGGVVQRSLQREKDSGDSGK